MIPPLMGSTPVPESTDPTGEGFADAMAAALGVMSPPPVTLPPTPADQDVVPAIVASTSPGTTLTVPAPAPFTTMPDQVARLVVPTSPAVDGAESAGVADPTAPPSEGQTQIESPVNSPALTLPLAEPEMSPSPLASVGDSAETVAPETIAGVTAPEPAAAMPRPAVVPSPTAPPRPEAAATLTRPVQESMAPDITPPTNKTSAAPVVSEPTISQPDATPAPAMAPSLPSASGERPAAADARPANPADQVEPHVHEPVETTTLVAAAEPTPGHTSGVATSESTTVPSSVLRRVEDAVRRLENAPPPRTITITVDDHGLHRVTVSLMSDGVKLSVPDGAATDPQLVTDMERALESRGFDMSGRQHRRSPDQTDDASDFVPTQAQTRRTEAGFRL